jgi:hypothetical protein
MRQIAAAFLSLWLLSSFAPGQSLLVVQPDRTLSGHVDTVTCLASSPIR